MRRLSAISGRTGAKLLVIEPHPAQSSFIAIDHIHHNDQLVLAFERYARANLAAPLNITAAASTLGTSRRTLERRVTRSLGTSPLSLVQRLRVERAAHLLRTTDQNADQVAAHVGDANGTTLRTLMRRLGRRSPHEPR